MKHTHTIQSNPIHTYNGIIGFDLILDKQDKIKLDQFTFFVFGLPNIHKYSYKELLQYLKKKIIFFFKQNVKQRSYSNSKIDINSIKMTIYLYLTKMKIKFKKLAINSAINIFLILKKGNHDSAPDKKLKTFYLNWQQMQIKRFEIERHEGKEARGEW